MTKFLSVCDQFRVGRIDYLHHGLCSPAKLYLTAPYVERPYLPSSTSESWRRTKVLRLSPYGKSRLGSPSSWSQLAIFMGGIGLVTEGVQDNTTGFSEVDRAVNQRFLVASLMCSAYVTTYQAGLYDKNPRSQARV